MKTRFILFLLFLSTISWGQGPNYRFQTSLSLHSILNSGIKSFSGLENDYGTLTKYENEWYDIDYKNFTISNGLNLKFAVNWINKDKYALRTSTSLFLEIYTEEVTYELVDFEIGDTAYYPNPKVDEDVELGYRGSAIFQGMSVGTTHEILYLRKFVNGLAIGAGMTYTWRSRNDLPSYTSSYAPIASMRATPDYLTKQLGFSFQLERNFERWSWFINLNQEFYTAKKEENKGAQFFNDPFTKFPVSHNLDYRFPLILQFGGTIRFGKIK